MIPEGLGLRTSVRGRLTAAFIGLAVGPLLLVGVVLAWQSLVVQKKQAVELQHEVAQKASVNVSSFVTKRGGPTKRNARGHRFGRSSRR